MFVFRQGLLDVSYLHLEFVERNLIGLRQDEGERNFVEIQPAHHGIVELGGTEAGVDDLHAECDLFPVVEKRFDKGCPTRLHLLGHFRVAVTGQVNEVHLLVHKIVVQFSGFSGGSADPGETLSIAELVQEGRFPHIRPADEYNLGEIVFGKLF